MRFNHGDLSPGNVVSLRAGLEFEIQADGTFEVESPELIETVLEHYDPVSPDEMGYRELQSVASLFDDITGNLPEDELREAVEEQL